MTNRSYGAAKLPMVFARLFVALFIVFNGRRARPSEQPRDGYLRARMVFVSTIGSWGFDLDTLKPW